METGNAATGGDTISKDYLQFRKMRANTCYLKRGIQGTKRKERRKIAQALISRRT